MGRLFEPPLLVPTFLLAPSAHHLSDWRLWLLFIYAKCVCVCVCIFLAASLVVLVREVVAAVGCEMSFSRRLREI